MSHILSAQWLRKLEEIVERMSHPEFGIPIKNIQGLVTKIQGVVAGSDIVVWIGQNIRGLQDAVEAHHLAHVIACHGYLFPVDNRYFSIKSDGSLYRIQARRYWLSQEPDPDNTEYAVYLAKRSIQQKASLELDDYEQESLARLQKLFNRKWNWIMMQAESQAKIDKKKDKIDKKISDSQERAFWDLHRPAPGLVNSVEVDVRRSIRSKLPKPDSNYVKGTPHFKGTAEHILNETLQYMKALVERRRQPLSKISTSLVSYCEKQRPFDPCLTPPESGNVWITDNPDWFEGSDSKSFVPQRRYQRWTVSIDELLKDEAGKDEFRKFLEKEVSAENLDFWVAIRELKTCPAKSVKTKVAEIYVEFLVDGALKGINVDSKVAEQVRLNVVTQPNRYAFDVAEDHIYNLMKTDSYHRFIRSEQFKDFTTEMRKKRSTSFTGKLALFNPRLNTVTS